MKTFVYTFPIQNCLTQGYPFHFVLEYAIRKAQENQDELKLK